MARTFFPWYNSSMFWSCESHELRSPSALLFYTLLKAQRNLTVCHQLMNELHFLQRTGPQLFHRFAAWTPFLAVIQYTTYLFVSSVNSHHLSYLFQMMDKYSIYVSPFLKSQNLNPLDMATSTLGPVNKARQCPKPQMQLYVKHQSSSQEVLRFFAVIKPIHIFGFTLHHFSSNTCRYFWNISNYRHCFLVDLFIILYFTSDIHHGFQCWFLNKSLQSSSETLPLTVCRLDTNISIILYCFIRHP